MQKNFLEKKGRIIIIFFFRKMRLKYSRFAKLFGLVLLFVFVIPFFFKNIEKTPLRSAVDLERQIDLAFKNEGLKVAAADNNNNNAPVCPHQQRKKRINTN